MYHKQISILFCVVQLLFYFSVYMVHFKQVYIDLCGVEFWHCAVIPHTGVLMGGFPLYLPFIGPQLLFSLFCISLRHLSQAKIITEFNISRLLQRLCCIECFILLMSNPVFVMASYVSCILATYCITGIRRTSTLYEVPFFGAHLCLNEISVK